MNSGSTNVICDWRSPSGLHQVRLRHQRGGDQDQQVRGRQLPVQLGRRRQEDGLPRPFHGQTERPEHEPKIV